jgi:hypothetical protein
MSSLTTRLGWKDAVGAIALAYLLWKIAAVAKKLVEVPKHLRRLPHLSVLQTFQVFTLSPPERHEFIKRVVGAAPAYRYWVAGKWVVKLRDPNLASTVFQQTSVFPKAQPADILGKGSLSHKLFGTNIVFANSGDWKRQRKVLSCLGCFLFLLEGGAARRGRRGRQQMLGLRRTHIRAASDEPRSGTAAGRVHQLM